MPPSIPLTFLGTGNFPATGGYWNSFLIGRRILVESSPCVLRNLQLVGAELNDIEVIFLSHFHADHTFGWPFLYFMYVTRSRRMSDLWVVGPPSIEAFLDNMVRAGALDHIVKQVHARGGGFQVRFVEVDEGDQQAGAVPFRAVRVEHDPALECFGYLVQYEGRTIGYSGDSTLCDGLRRLVAQADVMVLECNQREEISPVHMTLDDIRTLRAEFPDTPFVLTHRAHDVDDGGIPHVRVPRDLETLEV